MGVMQFADIDIAAKLAADEDWAKELDAKKRGWPPHVIGAVAETRQCPAAKPAYSLPRGVYLNFWPATVAVYMRPPFAIVKTATPFQYPPFTVASFAPPLAPDVAPVVPALAEAPAVTATALTPASNSYVPIRMYRVALFLEENDLAVSFAARLKAGAQLRHRRVTHVLVLNVHAAFACAPPTMKPPRHGWEHCVA